MLGNDTDVDVGDTQRAVAALVRSPTSGTLALEPNGAFTYTPSADFNGDDAFQYQVMDAAGALSSIATVFLTVHPVEDAPVADAQVVTIPQDTAKTLTLTATDVDGDPLTYRVVASPAHGTLTGTAPTLTYTPTPGYEGPDSFTFTAGDDQRESAPATVSLRIRPIGVLAVDHVVSADGFGTTVTTPASSARLFPARR